MLCKYGEFIWWAWPTRQFIGMSVAFEGETPKFESLYFSNQGRKGFLTGGDVGVRERLKELNARKFTTRWVL